MPDKEIFVMKIVWMKSIASLHRLTQAVQRGNLSRTAGDPTWLIASIPVLKGLIRSKSTNAGRKNIFQVWQGKVWYS